MKVLVCGGRDYADVERVYAVLDKLHNESGIDLIIEGGERGAHHIASDWARLRGVTKRRYDADWQSHGSFADPMRNKTMINDGQPDVVIAFPGGRETRQMINLSRKMGFTVVEITP